MSRIITLRFMPLLHCFYLCPLCGLAERWAIFWRSTQLNKMISNQQTARGATLKTRTARESVCLRACACAGLHVQIISPYIYVYLGTADSVTSLIVSGLERSFSNHIAHKRDLWHSKEFEALAMEKIQKT